MCSFNQIIDVKIFEPFLIHSDYILSLLCKKFKFLFYNYRLLANIIYKKSKQNKKIMTKPPKIIITLLLITTSLINHTHSLSINPLNKCTFIHNKKRMPLRHNKPMR